jgi:hypothetical protein
MADQKSKGRLIESYLHLQGLASPKEFYGLRLTQLINGRHPLEGVLGSEDLVHSIFGAQLPLQFLSLFPLRYQLCFFVKVGSVENFECFYVFWQRCSLIDDSFKFLVFLFKSAYSNFMFSDEFFAFLFHSFCKSGYLLVLDDDALVEISSKIILLLPAFVLDFFDLILLKE